MGLLKKWFQPKYKIVPVYTSTYGVVFGFAVMRKRFAKWVIMKMYVTTRGSDDTICYDALFATYENALDFVNHETTIIENEKVHNPKDDRG